VPQEIALYDLNARENPPSGPPLRPEGLGLKTRVEETFELVDSGNTR
jgi:hypothetical protein